MGVEYRQEARLPRAESLALVQDVGRRIRPDDSALEDWCRRYIAGEAERVAYDLDYVRQRFSSSDALVDVGAAPLLLTGALQRLGYDVVGIDVDATRFTRSAAELGVRVVTGDIEREELPFAEGTFRGVVLNEVFEHLRYNPVKTLRELRRLLQPGGTLFLSTPNLRSIHRLASLLVLGKTGVDVFDEYTKLESYGHMGHVREYTCREVCDTLRKTGFEVDTVVFRGAYWPRSEQLRRLRRLLPVYPLLRLLPSLRPHFSVLATRVGA